MHYNSLAEIDNILNILNIFEKKKLNFYFTQYYFNNIDSIKYTFDQLDRDNYYSNLRYRAYSLLKITEKKIEIIGNMPFFQSDNYNKYNGNYIRNYNNINDQLCENNEFIQLVTLFNNRVSELLEIKNEYINIHQIRVLANEDITNLVPEGIHQDGFNIVGICCINRKNINGGINIIYDKNKNEIYKNMLNEGDMIIINDNELFHNVEPIQINNNIRIGYRDIFVFTTIS